MEHRLYIFQIVVETALFADYSDSLTRVDLKSIEEEYSDTPSDLDRRRPCLIKSLMDTSKFFDTNKAYMAHNEELR